MVRRLVLAALLGSAVVALPAVPAQAIGSCGVHDACTTTYYSSVARTTIVGQVLVECDGQTFEWGTLRGFAVETNTPCGA